jgi:catechol 2,3-dioxygenase-like lactoylglutathione lyase family enzyme
LRIASSRAVRHRAAVEREVDGSQRHRPCVSDRVELCTLDQIYYCVGGRTGLAITAPAPEHAGAAFQQNRIGLHHLCFRARERADVDELHDFLRSIGTTIIRAPREDQWAPGYYSLLFEDPDGIRLELNHVPGKGLLGSADAKLQW